VNTPLHVLEILGRGGLGPMELHVLRLAEGLQDAGVRVSAVCPGEGPAQRALRALGCDVLVTAVGDNPGFCSVRDVACHVEDEAVDVVHAHYANAHVLGVLAAAVAARPCVATLHGPHVGMRDLEAHKLGRDAHLHVLDDAARRHARAIGVAPGRLHRVVNDTAPAPARLFRAAGSRVVGIVANAATAAALERALHAAGCEACMLGTRAGRAVPGREHPLPEVGACVVGDPADVPPTLLDALAAGVPVISPAQPEIAELLRPENAILVDTGDAAGAQAVAALAHAAAALLRDVRKADAVSAAAREAARPWPRPGLVAGMAQLLERLAGRGGGTSPVLSSQLPRVAARPAGSP
jgi:hypothetical protein